MQKYDLCEPGLCEVDYWPKLSEQDAQWLRQFLMEHTGSVGQKDTILHTPEQNKENYNNKYARRNSLKKGPLMQPSKLTNQQHKIFAVLSAKFAAQGPGMTYPALDIARDAGVKPAQIPPAMRRFLDQGLVSYEIKGQPPVRVFNYVAPAQKDQK